jgi:hypothetical protein
MPPAPAGVDRRLPAHGCFEPLEEVFDGIYPVACVPHFVRVVEEPDIWFVWVQLILEVEHRTEVARDKPSDKINKDVHLRIKLREVGCGVRAREVPRSAQEPRRGERRPARGEGAILAELSRLVQHKREPCRWHRAPGRRARIIEVELEDVYALQKLLRCCRLYTGGGPLQQRNIQAEFSERVFADEAVNRVQAVAGLELLYRGFCFSTKDTVNTTER